jgi:hypothetical protein
VTKAAGILAAPCACSIALPAWANPIMGGPPLLDVVMIVVLLLGLPLAVGILYAVRDWKRGQEEEQGASSCGRAPDRKHSSEGDDQWRG